MADIKRFFKEVSFSEGIFILGMTALVIVLSYILIFEAVEKTKKAELDCEKISYVLERKTNLPFK